MKGEIQIPGTDPGIVEGWQFVSKADLRTDTGTAATHQMNATQSDEFIDMGMDAAVLIKDSHVQPMDAQTEDINQLDLDGLASTIGASDEVTEVTAAERALNTFTRAQLDAQEFLLQGRISRSWVESNVAKNRGREQVHQQFSNGFLWGLENAAWRGDTTGSNPSGWGNRLGTTIDGWRSQSTTYTYDHGGAVPNRLLCHEMIQALPTKYRQGDWKKKYVFYMHPDSLEDLRYSVETRETNAADGLLLRDDVLRFRGIPFKEAAAFQTNITGTGAASGLGANTTEVLLCEPKNKVAGYHREVFVYQATSFDGRIFYITYSVRFDVAFIREPAVVRGYNVKNAIS